MMKCILIYLLLLASFYSHAGVLDESTADLNAASITKMLSGKSYRPYKCRFNNSVNPAKSSGFATGYKITFARNQEDAEIITLNSAHVKLYTHDGVFALKFNGSGTFLLGVQCEEVKL